MSEDLNDWLSVAESAARTAGKRLREGSETMREITFEDRADVKLRADTDSETLIRKRLLSATPDIPIIGEEEGGDESLVRQDKFYWVVDPLDGTFNYLRSNPLCAVSIGLLRGLEPVLGVIYDFNHDVLYSGGDSLGLKINGISTHYGWAQNIAQAALSTGLPAGMDTSPAKLAAYLKIISQYKKVRMVGSAATSLAMVASGQMDVHFELGTRLWDIAAGIALVKGAGGFVRLTPSGTGKFLAYDVWAAGSESLLPSA